MKTHLITEDISAATWNGSMLQQKCLPLTSDIIQIYINVLHTIVYSVILVSILAIFIYIYIYIYIYIERERERERERETHTHTHTHMHTHMHTHKHTFDINCSY